LHPFLLTATLPVQPPKDPPQDPPTKRGRPANESQGAELQNQVHKASQRRSKVQRQELMSAIEAGDNTAVSRNNATRQAKKLEDQLFSIGGFELTLVSAGCHT